MIETIYLAGGCLWGVQHYMKSIPGVIKTEAGRANGTSGNLDGEYDGYAECVKVEFAPETISPVQLTERLFDIIDPYSIDQQGVDVGHKYRTGVYSENPKHLEAVREYLRARDDFSKLTLELEPLTNYVKSADEHQDRLELHPEDFRLCHIPLDVMNKYRK